MPDSERAGADSVARHRRSVVSGHRSTGSAPRTDVVARLTHVGRRFPGPPPVDAVRDANLTLRRGEHVAIMGPSGSGKTTLLNVLGLLDRPTRGTYELDAADVSALGEQERTRWRRQAIGFVFQDFFLLPGRTAWENVALALVYRGWPSRQRRSRALQALDHVGLAERLDALPGTLSGGERQRVAIARALVNDPILLLCDEPTGNLDSTTARGVMSLIAGLHQTGLTVVTITHDPATATWADRCLRLADGTMVEGSFGVDRRAADRRVGG